MRQGEMEQAIKGEFLHSAPQSTTGQQDKGTCRKAHRRSPHATNSTAQTARPQVKTPQCGSYIDTCSGGGGGGGGGGGDSTSGGKSGRWVLCAQNKGTCIK